MGDINIYSHVHSHRVTSYFLFRQARYLKCDSMLRQIWLLSTVGAAFRPCGTLLLHRFCSPGSLATLILIRFVDRLFPDEFLTAICFRQVLRLAHTSPTLLLRCLARHRGHGFFVRALLESLLGSSLFGPQDHVTLLLCTPTNTFSIAASTPTTVKIQSQEQTKIRSRNGQEKGQNKKETETKTKTLHDTPLCITKYQKCG
ncbi:hypothetical protein JB92DRAFT_1219424 [Gautieria morchelliformis]|nr:hypothetical protein JB92DRAFT_1219424 [Gautieria morchelliformis]